MDRAAQGRSSSRTGHGAPEEQTNLPEPIRASPSYHGRTIYSVAPPPDRGTNATNWHDKGRSVFPPVEVDRSDLGPYAWSSVADKLLNANFEPRDGSRTRTAPHEASEAVANEERAPNSDNSYPVRSSTPPPDVFDRDDHVPISEYHRGRTRLAVGGAARENQATAPVAARKRKAQLQVTLNPHEEKRAREDHNSDDALSALEAGVARYFWASDSAPRPPSRRSPSPMDTSDDDDDDGTESDSSAYYSFPDLPESEADYDHRYDTDTDDDKDMQEDDEMYLATWPKALSDHPCDRLRLYKPAVPTPLNPARAATLTPLEVRHAYALAFKHKHPYMTSAYDRPAFVARHLSDCDHRLCVPWNAVLRADQPPREQKRCRACMQEQDQPRRTWRARASRRWRAQLKTEDVLERLFQEVHERSTMYDDDYGYGSRSGVDYSGAYE